MSSRIAQQSVPRIVCIVLFNARLRKAAFNCAAAAIKDFFFLQFSANIFKGRIPVSGVDHALDQKIPFRPGLVGVYLDFVFFWIRMVGVLLEQYGRNDEEVICEFIRNMGSLYRFAAQVYRKNLSTTERPFYIKNPRFLLIHLADPHLLCVPSLHIMVVVYAHLAYRRILEAHGDTELLDATLPELRAGALRISEAVLLIKQHSVNCIATALYALSSLDGELVTQAVAHDFIDNLFPEGTDLELADTLAVRTHIRALYDEFLAEGREASDWTEPLLAFLASCPRVS